MSWYLVLLGGLQAAIMQKLSVTSICRRLAEIDKLLVRPISRHSLARTEQAIHFLAQDGGTVWLQTRWSSLILNYRFILTYYWCSYCSENCLWRQTESTFSVFQCNVKKTTTQALNSLWYLRLSNGRLQAIQQSAEQINMTEIAKGFLL